MATSNSEKNPNAFDAEAPPQYVESSNFGNRDNLPSYDSSAQQDPPPSYESLYGRIKAAKNESSGVLNFMKTFFVIILSTIGFTILIGIFMAIPVAMLVMGVDSNIFNGSRAQRAVHLHDCSVEPMIPIYLIVAGCFGCVRNLYSLVQRCRKSEEEREEDQKKVNPAESLISCFLFAWFITGCVYIYRTKGEFQSTQPELPNYCDYSLYWFAFWVTTSVYIIMAVSCCCVCFVGLLAACFGNP